MLHHGTLLRPTRAPKYHSRTIEYHPVRAGGARVGRLHSFLDQPGDCRRLRGAPGGARDTRSPAAGWNKKLHLCHGGHIRIASLQPELRPPLDHDQRHWFCCRLRSRCAQPPAHSASPGALRGSGLLCRAAPNQWCGRISVHAFAILDSRLVLRRARLCAGPHVDFGPGLFTQDDGSLLRHLCARIVGGSTVRARPSARSDPGRLGNRSLFPGLWGNFLDDAEVVAAAPALHRTQRVPVGDHGDHCWILGDPARDRTSGCRGAGTPTR